MITAIRRRLEDREEGFTLIELLVVVIIIGILAAVAIPVFLNQRQRAYRAAVQSDLRNLAVEAETHFTDGTTYAGFALPADFGSDGVAGNIDVQVTGAGDSYCIEASHTQNAAEVWTITPGNNIREGTCTDGAFTAP